MKKPIVSIVRFDKTPEAVRSAVDLCHGLDHLPSKARVFIKPNIVYWTRATLFPMWGVITTSRVVEDMVILLKERGINDITIGEGGIAYDPKDKETAAHALMSAGERCSISTKMLCIATSWSIFQCSRLIPKQWSALG